MIIPLKTPMLYQLKKCFILKLVNPCSVLFFNLQNTIISCLIKSLFYVLFKRSKIILFSNTSPQFSLPEPISPPFLSWMFGSLPCQFLYVTSKIDMYLILFNTRIGFYNFSYDNMLSLFLRNTLKA